MFQTEHTKAVDTRASKLERKRPPSSNERGRRSAHLKIAAAERSMGGIEMVRDDGSTMLRSALGIIILCFLSC